MSLRMDIQTRLMNENTALKFVLNEERENYKRLEALYDILHKAITDSRADLADEPKEHLTAVELEKLEKQLFTAGLDIKLVKNNEKYLVRELVQRLVNLQEQHTELASKKSCWNKVPVADINKLNERFKNIGLDLRITSRDPDTIIAELADTLAVVYTEYQNMLMDKQREEFKEKLAAQLVFSSDDYDEPSD